MLVLHKLSRGLGPYIIKRLSSSTTAAAAKKTPDAIDENSQKKTSSMVAAAFASLKEDTGLPESTTEKSTEAVDMITSSVDENIINAKSVNGLLAISDGNGTITRKQALRIVSILAEWSSINRAKLSDFENDARFLKLCRLLGRSAPKKSENSGSMNNAKVRTDDLSTVLGIAGDDEAAKLISSISLPQMVKVMTTLAVRKRRSTPLLRSLAFNISSKSEQLDLKQSADVLYSMASLNFPDSVLTAKICVDIQATLPSNTDKSAVVGSILTSLGLLKYRDLDVLESLFNWVLKHSDKCRPQDINALFLTLATLNHKPSNEVDMTKLINLLNADDFPKKQDWLNQVWSLVILKLADAKHVDSVLRKDFLKNLESEKNGMTPNMKMKLLNINSYAKLLLADYKGSLLSDDSPAYSVPLGHSKSKQILLNSMLDALKSLMTSPGCVNSLVDTKMGFVIDAKCMFDARRNPLQLNKEHKDAIKVAIMTVDFHDMCHGTHRSLSGLTQFSFELLEKSGLKVLTVPYNEFSTSDKLLKRVQYLENKFKQIVSTKK